MDTAVDDQAIPPDLLAGRPWLRHYEPGIPAEVAVPDITIDRFLRDAAARWPERVALDFLGAKTTFRELDQQVDRLAGALRGLGLEPGDRVSLHLPTTPGFVVAFLGVARAGGIVATVSPLAVEREIEVLLGIARPRLSICLDLLVPRIAAARAAIGPALPAPRRGSGIVSSGIQDCLPSVLRMLYPLKARREGRWRPVRHSQETPNLFRLVAEGPPGRVDAPVRPEDPALLQATGGTTGVPKAAALSHRNLVANAVQIGAWFPAARPGEMACLCALPYFHIYGLTVAMTYPLSIGATQVMQPRWDAKAVLKAIARTRPQLFPGAPMFYSSLLDLPETRAADLHSIEACISGAAPLPGPVQDGFEALTGGRLVEGYGLTEASPVTHANPIHGQRRLGTVGLPLPSTEGQVVDLGTGRRVLPPGEVGELRVRGPQVMLGYWERPDETALVLRDGWLYTGDCGVMDDDGYFRIVERLKDLIIVSGVNVYPREVEDVLLAHPAVAEASVVGQPDARKGEVPRAYVVLRPGVSATREELLADCRANLSTYKVPVAVEIRKELPKTFVGKVLRRVLSAEREAQPGDDTGGAEASDGPASDPRSTR
ncbi:MAG TPA: long-chain fatty acid--CoA ligase [Candidatus Limnocylindrales bacterium]|nr:long-chain fatty acid--CoA ligase [Candidatus Limnocylindrales bacterium]